jgi:hypothetical protein
MFQEITFEYKFSLQFTVLLSNLPGITPYINYNLRQHKLPGARLAVQIAATPKPTVTDSRGRRLSRIAKLKKKKKRNWQKLRKILRIQKQIKEVLGRINHLFSRYGMDCKVNYAYNYSIVVCYSLHRGNVVTEPLPSNGRDTYINTN